MLPPHFGLSGLDREASAKDEAVPRPAHTRGAVSAGTRVFSHAKSLLCAGVASLVEHYPLNIFSLPHTSGASLLVFPHSLR